MFTRAYVEGMLGEILATFSGVFNIFAYFCGKAGYFCGDIDLGEDIQDFISERVPVAMYVHFNEMPKNEDVVIESVWCTVKDGVCVCVWNSAFETVTEEV